MRIVHVKLKRGLVNDSMPIDNDENADWLHKDMGPIDEIFVTKEGKVVARVDLKKSEVESEDEPLKEFIYELLDESSVPVDLGYLARKLSPYGYGV